VATDQSGKVAWQDANVFVRTKYADRIIKIDDNADMGTNVNQIEYDEEFSTWTYSGMNASDQRYQHDDHYNQSGNTNTFFKVHFKGVKIDAYATVASHHGPAWASIDGGPETAVNYNAPTRGEQVFVYGSPVLASGVHVLKIRVGSTNVPTSVVTADRFDVHAFDVKLIATSITKVNDTVTIDLTSPNPGGSHQLLQSTGLTDWSANLSAVVTQTGADTIRASLSGVTNGKAFFRVVLLP
jgi:hypothetical protein